MSDVDVGKMLTQARRAAGMSRVECAYGLGVTVEELADYERGCAPVPRPILSKIFRWGVAVVVGAKIVERNIL